MFERYSKGVANVTLIEAPVAFVDGFVKETTKSLEEVAGEPLRPVKRS